jgi:putative Mg2+ transporter-C (MgtC) family protein
MTGDLVDIVEHLGVAAIAGGLIGFERSYHGRPAGFRTHTLVCMASSLLMLVTIYQKQWFLGDMETLRIDPTRMAQGVMTGIGFLGAGVIMKEGLSVRGLTTAASIWMTASIGILAGVGFYSAVIIGTVLALVVLMDFLRIERAVIPMLTYARLTLRFRRDRTMPEAELLELITRLGFSVTNLSYSAEREGNFFEYAMSIGTRNKANMHRLSDILSDIESVTEFHIHQTGN